MTPVSKSRRALLHSLLAAPAVLGTSANAQDAAGNGRKVLRYAFPVAETGFDPAQITDLYSRAIVAHIFDGLYKYDYLARPFKIRPNVADGMPEVTDDFRTWTVRVRPGIHFTDDPAFKGRQRELTAEDFVYSLKRYFDPRWKSPAYAALADLQMLGLDGLRAAALAGRPFDYDTPVDGMRALDRRTIRFRFAQPQPRFLQVITGGDLYSATAREVVEAYGEGIMEHPVGTGPFRLADWRRSSKIVLERNPGFRDLVYDAQPNADDAEGQALAAQFRGRRLPMIDRVEVSIIDEQQPRWLAFLNRQFDLMERLPNEFVNLAIPNGRLAPNLARRGVRMHRTLGSDVTMTVFNMDHPVVGGYTPENVALRRALNLATNVKQEIRLIRRGQAIIAHSNLVPNTFGYDAQFASEAGTFDLPRARALLDLYGYVDRDGDGWRERPDGAPLVIEIATQPDQQSRQLDELQRKDYAALGVRTAFRPAKWPENLKAVRAGRFMVWRVGSSAGAPDGQPALTRAHSAHVGGQNIARFRNPQFDAVFDRLSVIEDGPERLELFERAKKIMVAYAPYKPNTHRILTDLAHPWLHGYRRAPYWNDWWQYVDIDADAQAEAQA